MGATKFGKYTLIEKITTGGMAEVYRGVAVGPGGFTRVVAIKKILPCFADSAEFLRMFQDEASIAARLNHANIAQVYDFDIVDGVPYLAMEFVEGKDVRSILQTCAERDIPIPWPLAVYVALEVAKGLYYVHTRRESSRPLNIVHRDVSPQNIMVSRSGEVKLVDFGIARAVNRQAVTFAGTVKGKYAYMSPEQVSGQPVDHRSDIFSLGTVLWEMLTLRRLFAGANEGETIARLQRTRVPACHIVNPEVPERLSPLVMKALTRNRSERYPTMLAFHEAFSRVLFDSGAYPDIEGISRFVYDLFPEEMERLAQGEHLAFEPEGTPEIRVERAGSELEQVVEPSSEVELDDTIRDKEIGTETRPVSLPRPEVVRPRRLLKAVGGMALLAALVAVGLLFGQQVLTRFAAQEPVPEVAVSTDVGTGTAPALSVSDRLPATAPDVGTGTAPALSVSDRLPAAAPDVGTGTAPALSVSDGLPLVAEDAGVAPAIAFPHPPAGAETAQAATRRAFKLDIKTDPPDARIWVGPMPFKPGAVEVEGVAGNEVVLKLTRSGYAPEQHTVVLADGFARTYRMSRPARLDLYVKPQRSLVLIEGKPVAEGKRGHYVYSGRLGDAVTVEVSADGHTQETRIVPLEKSEEKIRFDLVRTPTETPSGNSTGRISSRGPSDRPPGAGTTAPKGTVSPPSESDSPRVVGTAKATGSGVITIQAEPYAEARVDGKTWGQVPIVRRELSAGEHTVVLRYMELEHICRVKVEVGGEANCSHTFPMEE